MELIFYRLDKLWLFSVLRVTERDWLQRAAYLQSLAIGLTPIVPMAAAVVTFLVHTASGNDLSVSQVSTIGLHELKVTD